MEEVSIIGIDLAKRSFQVHGGEGERVGSVPQEAEPREAAEFSRRAAALHGGDGGVRRRPLLGPGDRGPAGHEVRLVPPIYVKPFVKRQKNDAAGRGGDHGSSAASDHALRGGQDRSAAGRRGCSSARVTCWCASARRPSMRFGVTWPSTAWLLRRAGPGSEQLAWVLEDGDCGLPEAVVELGWLLLGADRRAR